MPAARMQYRLRHHRKPRRRFAQSPAFGDRRSVRVFQFDASRFEYDAAKAQSVEQRARKVFVESDVSARHHVLHGSDFGTSARFDKQREPAVYRRLRRGLYDGGEPHEKSRVGFTGGHGSDGEDT